jgi:hypothetical protein
MKKLGASATKNNAAANRSDLPDPMSGAEIDPFIGDRETDTRYPMYQIQIGLVAGLPRLSKMTPISYVAPHKFGRRFGVFRGKIPRREKIKL